jgi:hypothetical protein
MVALPTGFVATKYPGYFWNLIDKKLYSLKVTGVLTPLAYNKGGTFYGRYIEPGYQISVCGRKRRYTLEYLNTLKYAAHQEIPVMPSNNVHV